jgi:hypothetical protein
MPQGLAVALRYDSYDAPNHYLVALKSGTVYEKPDVKSKKLRSFTLGVRMATDRLVEASDGKSRWYRVMWADKHGKHAGYVKETAGAGRSFRLDAMLDRVTRLQAEANKPSTVFVLNYKNRKGHAPALPGGAETDTFGYRRDQSAPAYLEPDVQSEFRYAPDGMLGTAVEKRGGFTKVWFPTFGEARWVPDKFISKDADAIPKLTQVVVVDRPNQNAAAFEYVTAYGRSFRGRLYPRASPAGIQ